MKRILEPEVMDSMDEALDYDSMDFTEVNTSFAQRAVEIGPKLGKVLDVGTGTARIPIIIASMKPQWQILGVDLAESMLRVGKENIYKAGLSHQISLDKVDGKSLPYSSDEFDMVICNSLVHHLPNPNSFFSEVNRVLKSNGAVLIRDLIRPENDDVVNKLVDSIGPEYNDGQKKLFRDSLHAAFTVDEVKNMVEDAGFMGVDVYQSSDIHWTVERKSTSIES